MDFISQNKYRLVLNAALIDGEARRSNGTVKASGLKDTVPCQIMNNY